MFIVQSTSVFTIRLVIAQFIINVASILLSNIRACQDVNKVGFGAKGIFLAFQHCAKNKKKNFSPQNVFRGKRVSCTHRYIMSGFYRVIKI